MQWTVPLAGLLIYLLVITSYRLPIGDVAIAIALLGLVFLPGGIRFPGYLRWFTLFAIWVWIIASRDTEYPRELLAIDVDVYRDWVAPQIMNILKLWLIVLVAANALRTREQCRLFMVCFLGCFALFPLRGAMMNYFFYHHDMAGRAVWRMLYSNPNDLGAMALLQLSMAACLVVAEPKGWVRWTAIAGLFTVPLLILMTQSRGVFLGLMVFGAVVLTGQRRRVRFALRIGAVAVLLAAVAPSGVWGRLRTLERATSTSRLAEVDGESGSTRQRWEIWQVAFAIIGDYPLSGVGIGAYKPMHYVYAQQERFNPTARGGRDTHSLYFNVTAETGIPGLIMYLGVLLRVVIAAERARRRCRGVHDTAARQLVMLEAGLLAFLTASIFGSLPYLPHLQLHLVLLFGLASVYTREADERRRVPVVPSRSAMTTTISKEAGMDATRSGRGGNLRGRHG